MPDEIPRVKADEADITTFFAVAHAAQGAARAMADLQNTPSIHGLTPQQAGTLAALVRGPGPITLNDDERNALVALLDGAGRAAIMLPAYNKRGLSVTNLVTVLLNAGNLLEQAARNAQPNPPKGK